MIIHCTKFGEEARKIHDRLGFKMSGEDVILNDAHVTISYKNVEGRAVINITIDSDKI